MSQEDCHNQRQVSRGLSPVHSICTCKIGNKWSWQHDIMIVINVWTVKKTLVIFHDTGWLIRRYWQLIVILIIFHLLYNTPNHFFTAHVGIVMNCFSHPQAKKLTLKKLESSTYSTKKLAAHRQVHRVNGYNLSYGKFWYAISPCHACAVEQSFAVCFKLGQKFPSFVIRDDSYDDFAKSGKTWRLTLLNLWKHTGSTSPKKTFKLSVQIHQPWNTSFPWQCFMEILNLSNQTMIKTNHANASKNRNNCECNSSPEFFASLKKKVEQVLR